MADPLQNSSKGGSSELKVSIITVVKNNSKTIEDTIRSVASQDYHDIEHIIIDGVSTDGTLDKIHKHKHRLAQFVSEPDQGIYDAMNKGISFATGELIGFLNGDDIYAGPEVVSDVVEAFHHQDTDSVFGDQVFVDILNSSKIIRYYSSGYFTPKRIANGWMPAHQTIFFKKTVYEKYGKFKIDYQIAADFEFIARVYAKAGISYYYLPRVMVKMRKGGVSTKNWKSNWIINKEIMRACRENGIPTNYFRIYSKYPRKLLGLIKK